MNRSEHRFSVLLWLEPGENAEGQWRGAVDHIGSGRRMYFSSLGDLTDFIRVRLGAPADAQPAERAET
jgi:hypothetical protein